MTSLYDLAAASLEGPQRDLSEFRDKVVLVVNVASACGYTPQYQGLQELPRDLGPRGFAVLGFPSNEFGGQEPGSPEEIRTFCTERYAVDFPLFAKVRTQAGDGQSPVYALLGEAAGALPAWNFAKYLVGRDGRALAFFDSSVDPASPELRAAIDRALDA